CWLRLFAETLAARRDPARDPAGLRRPPGKAQCVPGGGGGGEQRQATSCASFGHEHAPQGLQSFHQPQVISRIELPGERLVTAVDRRCLVALEPGQPGTVVPGAGGIYRQTALSRVAGGLLVPASRVVIAG